MRCSAHVSAALTSEIRAHLRDWLAISVLQVIMVAASPILGVISSLPPAICTLHISWIVVAGMTLWVAHLSVGSLSAAAGWPRTEEIGSGGTGAVLKDG